MVGAEFEKSTDGDLMLMTESFCKFNDIILLAKKIVVRTGG